MNLRPSIGEITYQRMQFYESLLVQGIPCVISRIKNLVKEGNVTSLNTDVVYDFYNDISEEVGASSPYDVSFNTMITFDTAPTIKTLKSLGWYQELREGLPIIAHIPVLYKNGETLTPFTPSVDDKITLTSNPSDPMIVSSTQDYLIKDLQGAGFPSVIYYIAKVVPYRRNS